MSKNESNVITVKDEALHFISKLDDARWSASNMEEINYYDKSMSHEEKVLSHWLTYISDRQMPYERIWTFGGYVYSYIVSKWKEIIKNESNNETNRIRKINELFAKLIEKRESKEEEYTIKVKYDGPENDRLKKEGYKKGSNVYFISRYYTIDIKQIYLTLMVLANDYKGSLFKYIGEMTQITKNNKEKFKYFIYAMYLLTYKVNYIDKSQKKNSDANLSEFIEMNIKDDIYYEADYEMIRTNIVQFKVGHEKYIEEFDGMDKDKTKYFKSRPRFGGMKRIWCSIRDYMKSNYKEHFEECLKKYIGLSDDNERDEFIKNTLQYIELPGDVWNNNSKFRRCILKGDDKNGEPISYILRNAYKNDIDTWDKYKIYPEKFDVSFDLAMRMCDKNKCMYCLLGNDNIAQKFCIGKKDSKCPLTMIYCGYDCECKGKEECPFNDLFKKGN